jgi:hypothetical protein
MDPGAAMRAESSPNLRVIKAKALSKLVPVISAPNEFGDLARKKEE